MIIGNVIATFSKEIGILVIVKTKEKVFGDETWVRNESVPGFTTVLESYQGLSR